MKKNSIIFLLTLLIFSQSSYAQNYDELRTRLLSNFPQKLQPQLTPQHHTANSIVHQLIDDMEKVNFDEKKARWFHANDYVLYDATTNQKIGNTYYIIYKTADNKVIGSYLMNCENPANNRLLHSAYIKADDNFKIDKKVTREAFSHIVCKTPQKKISRF